MVKKASSADAPTAPAAPASSATVSNAVALVPAPALPPMAEIVPIAMAQTAKATRAATPPPVQHLQSLQILMGQWMARSSGNAANTAALLPHVWSTDLWQEMGQMQAAILRRLQLQQQAWVAGCTGLATEYQEGKRANTMSKLVEQQCNLVAQFGQLLSQQATSLVGLQENIEVDYGYWVSQKLWR
jgi:hypothetical protein